VESIERTPVGPSVDVVSLDEVSRVMSELSSDSRPKSISEVPRGISNDEVLIGTEISRAVIEFSDDRRAQQIQHLKANLRALGKKARTVRETIVQWNG